MGKNKRTRLAGHSGKKGPQKQSKISAKPISKPLSKLPSQTLPTSKKHHVQLQHSEPTIPFSKEDKILLIGEGDLSFAMSLLREHGCSHVTATVYEGSFEELVGKYPHVGENITILEAGVSDTGAVPGGEDAEEFDDKEDFGFVSRAIGLSKTKDIQLLYGIDATKLALGLGPGRLGPKGSKWDRIIFNFPHVGGKSTDVNRQVRYNQELLVNFFTKAIPILEPAGSIIITLFESHPYTLWNIKDLARHSGLAVERSFKFQASAYPGYHHSRTIGAIRRKDGEVGGGWKGEERPARSYVFVRKEDVVETVGKRKRVDEEEDEERSD